MQCLDDKNNIIYHLYVLVVLLDYHLAFTSRFFLPNFSFLVLYHNKDIYDLNQRPHMWILNMHFVYIGGLGHKSTMLEYNQNQLFCHIIELMKELLVHTISQNELVFT